MCLLMELESGQDPGSNSGLTRKFVLNDKQRCSQENSGNGKRYRKMTQFFIKLIMQKIIMEQWPWVSDDVEELMFLFFLVW